MATNLVSAKDGRPFESVLRPRTEWFRCERCGRTFAAAEGVRSHRRFNRCPAGDTPDPLDNPALTGDALRRAATRRLRYLAGLSEAP